MKRFLNILTVLALVVSLLAFGGCESTNRMSEVVIPRGEGQPPLRVVYIDHIVKDAVGTQVTRSDQWTQDASGAPLVPGSMASGASTGIVNSAMQGAAAGAAIGAGLGSAGSANVSATGTGTGNATAISSP